MMLKIACAICICLFALPALCEPQTKYELATIIAVKPYQTASDSEAQSPSYAISVKVRDVIYVVLYKDALFTPAVEYASGRELLVHVEKDTITYNDILGRSETVPIVSRKLAKSGKESK
jgi:hypothetical protein